MLKEVWLNIGIEKIDAHKGVMIKVLLNSGAIGMFMDKQITARHGFKLQKLERARAVVMPYKLLGQLSDILNLN